MSKELLKLFNYDRTILNYDDLSYIFSDLKKEYLKSKVSILCKNWILTRLAKWLFYVSDTKIDSFEIPEKLFSPSYISFHSALYYHKMIFQLPIEISFAYKRNIEKQIWDYYMYSKRLKDEILYNTTWIIINKNFSIAWKSRAFLDTLYIYNDIYIDNIDILDKNEVIELSKIYNNKNFEKRVKLYFNNI